MAKFKIPVTWSVTSEIEIEANSLEEAIEKFDLEENSGEGFPIPTDFEYLDGSFDRDNDIEYIEQYNEYNCSKRA